MGATRNRAIHAAWVLKRRNKRVRSGNPLGLQRVARRPAGEGAGTDAFEGKPQGECHGLTGIEFGIRTFWYV